MRILYFILFTTLNYALRIFYPRNKQVNSPKSFFGRTIYVSNHAASFMDPLVVAVLNRPIVFFMTRSDVFTTFSKPFLWACHMLPIYRQLDGQDTKGKNAKVFDKCTKILSYGRNLLIFGEGFTDDKFVRRLKPVKKGAARIGFQTLEKMDWKKNVYIAAIGCNYSNPNQMRSDLLISYSDKICLNDYREEFLKNPNKAISDVTKRIEELMQEQITYVQDIEQTDFHENIMILSRKGMNPDSFDRRLSLTSRWNYSRKLAKWLNKQDLENDHELLQLKADLDAYQKLLKRFKINDNLLYWKMTSKSRIPELLKIIFLFPLALIGMLHTAIPYIFIKRFVEKSFKRKVFWGSVKMILGVIILGFLNIPVIFLFYHFIYPSWTISILYYFSIGLTGLAAYMWAINLKRYKTKGVILKTNLDKLALKRTELAERIEKLSFEG